MGVLRKSKMSEKLISQLGKRCEPTPHGKDREKKVRGKPKRLRGQSFAFLFLVFLFLFYLLKQHVLFVCLFVCLFTDVQLQLSPVSTHYSG